MIVSEPEYSVVGRTGYFGVKLPGGLRLPVRDEGKRGVGRMPRFYPEQLDRWMVWGSY